MAHITVPLIQFGQCAICGVDCCWLATDGFIAATRTCDSNCAKIWWQMCTANRRIRQHARRSEVNIFQVNWLIRNHMDRQRTYERDYKCGGEA